MFYQLILHHLFQVGSFSAQMRQSVNNVLNQVEPVKFVLYSDVECRSDSAFFNVTPDMYIPVGAAVGQTMNQPWISMKTCLLYTSPSPRDRTRSRMPSSA